MPGPDEIRRYEAEHPISLTMKELLSSNPKAKFDPQVMRRNLAEQMAHRCVICGTSLSPAGNCPRCLNLIP